MFQLLPTFFQSVCRYKISHIQKTRCDIAVHIGQKHEKGLLVILPDSLVHCSHFFPHLLNVLFADNLTNGFIIPGEGNQVFRLVDVILLQFLVTRLYTHQHVSLPAEGVPQVTVATLVALNDAQCLPILDVVEEFVATDSDFAYKQLIDVVGVQSFFGSSSAGVSVVSPFGTAYHSRFNSKTLATA